MDPEIGLNIVDLGLVYQIDFNEEDKILYCMITLTTQFCPMGDSILLAAKEALQTAFEEYSIHIDLTFDPAWNHKMLSDFGKEFLNQL
jgi:metal-sulfur cluster biosynthetic enzyme